MIARNIEWDVDINDIYDVFDSMTYISAAKTLEIPIETYANMTTEERDDYIYDYFNHSQWLKNDFMGLPDEVNIPDSITEDEISNWLSDTYGYCHNGFKITYE